MCKFWSIEIFARISVLFFCILLNCRNNFLYFSTPFDFFDSFYFCFGKAFASFCAHKLTALVWSFDSFKFIIFFLNWNSPAALLFLVVRKKKITMTFDQDMSWVLWLMFYGIRDIYFFFLWLQSNWNLILQPEAAFQMP